MIVPLLEWSGMAWPGAWSFRTAEMQMHGLLGCLLFDQELEGSARDGPIFPVIEGYSGVLLLEAFIPSDDLTGIASQVDLVI
jgi:hypothetical protein